MAEPLRVLTFNWHEAYLHLLSKTGYTFDVVQKRKAGLYGWIEAFRPVPENMRLVHLHAALERLRAGFYDRVIAHNFEDLLAVRDCGVPIILVFHNKLTTEIALSRTPVDRKAYLQQAQRLMGSLPDLRLVFVSPAKQLDWGFEGRVILPGIDPGDYSGYAGDEPRVLRVGNGLKERDLMLGWSAQERILEGIPSTVVGLNSSLPESILPTSWDELRSLLVHHRVFLNTTLPPYEDGYNLAMLEAMATGMPVVSIANSSSPIEDGVNGFVSADEGVLRERILELLQDRERAIAIGRKARETVLERFPIDRFLSAWREVLEEGPGRGRAAFSAAPPARATTTRQRPRVLLSYTANPQTTGAYLERGLRSVCDVLTYGPAIDEEVLRKWDLEKIRGRLYGHDLPYFTADVGQILEHLPGGWKPDLFLWVESGVSYPLHGLSSLPCPTACWLIDTHLHLEGHLEIAKSFDFVFLAQKKYVPLFREAGIRQVHWLPLACDPEIHRNFGFEPVYDFSFVGSITAAHRRRDVLLQQLSRRFSLHVERCFLEEMALVLSRSRIVFNCSVRDDLNMRVFEALSTGSLLLTDQAAGSGLEELFEDGRHLAIYRSPEELEERAAHYLGHEQECARIAREGMQEVRARHTYAHRAAAILERVGLWETGSGSFDPARNGYCLGCGRHDDRIAQAVGEIYAREGRPEVAFKYFSQALSLNPENAHALKGMISTARAGAERAETIKSLEAYLALHPADLELTLSHADLCLQAGLPDESRRSVERILLFDPSHEAARALEMRIDGIFLRAGQPSASPEEVRQVHSTARTPGNGGSVKHHIIISGTGRAGTTFLVQLFTELGLDTGFKSAQEGIYENCHAGMEIMDLGAPGTPYIVKSPWFCDSLDEVLKTGTVVIDHAIVPMRDLFSAAESRRFVHRKAKADDAAQGNVHGGLWHTQNPAEQEKVLALQLYKLLYALAKHNVPLTLLHFPRFVHEPEYLYRRIRFLLVDTSFSDFLAAFRKVSRPELVHDFLRRPSASEPSILEADERRPA